jgi:hypothetical protein
MNFRTSLQGRATLRQSWLLALAIQETPCLGVPQEEGDSPLGPLCKQFKQM